MNYSKMVAINGVIAGLIVVMNLLNPFGWGAIQFRVSEIMSVIPFYKPKYTYGVIIGVFFSNINSPFGPIDAIVGVSIAVISYSLARYLKSHVAKNILFSVVAGLIVGLMLWQVLGLPFIASAVSVAISTMFMVTAGSILMEKFFLKLL